MALASCIKLFVLLSMFILPTVFAWGPVSHYYFAKESFNATYDIYSVKQACDMPDSFYFVNFGEFPNCQIDDTYIHDLTTASYLVQYAVGHHQKSSLSIEDQKIDPISFALGFGSHMVADMIGFHAGGGILGDTVPNYITTFPLMTALDSLAMSRGGVVDSYPWASTEGANLLSAFGDWYRANVNVSSSFPVYNASMVMQCIGPWQDTQLQLQALAGLQLNNSYYQQALLFYDQTNATHFQQVSEHFAMNYQCIQQAISYWASIVLSPSSDPAEATQHTASFVDELFAAGKCAPPSYASTRRRQAEQEGMKPL